MFHKQNCVPRLCIQRVYGNSVVSAVDGNCNMPHLFCQSSCLDGTFPVITAEALIFIIFIFWFIVHIRHVQYWSEEFGVCPICIFCFRM